LGTCGLSEAHFLPREGRDASVTDTGDA